MFLSAPRGTEEPQARRTGERFPWDALPGWAALERIDFVPIVLEDFEELRQEAMRHY